MKFLTYEDIVDINETLIKLLDKHPPHLGNPENLKKIVKTASEAYDLLRT